jgi:hypothetical protein
LSPFVCEDFTFGYSLLKGAYAELLIQALDRAPGVQIVEIAEARAVAAERGLAGDDALRRPLQPYFLEGSYRNKGEGEDRRVHVSVRLQRDGKSLSEPTADDLAPGAVGTFLQDVARTFVKEMLQIEPPSYDAGREVKQIDERIGELERLGDYEEAFRLIEVASLIQPGPPFISGRSGWRQNWPTSFTTRIFQRTSSRAPARRWMQASRRWTI